MGEHEPPANNIYQLEEFLNRTREGRMLWPKKNRLVDRANIVTRRGNVTLELSGADQSVKLWRRIGENFHQIVHLRVNGFLSRFE